MLNLPPELQSLLLDRRLVFVRGPLGEASTSETIPRLLLLSHTAAGRPVEVYLDSPGGSIAAVLAIYDVMGSLTSPVSVTCLGTAGGAAALLLASGTSGLRFSLPHARVHLFADEPGIDLARPVQDTSGAVANLRARWLDAFCQRTGQPAERIERDLAAGVWLSSDEAITYGLVDSIVARSPV
jgi:ATP-dependent Clp protease protease subunit